MAIIAWLVVREVTRRRLVLAVIVLTLLAVALTSWGLSRLPTLGARPPTPDQVRLIASQLVILIGFMFSNVLGLSAAFVAAPAISGEVETGIALAVIARPLSRASYVLGKWVGLAALLLVYTAGAITLELLAVRAVVDYEAPHPLETIAYLYAEGLVLLTLSLALSTRLSGMVGGVVALVLFGMAWMGGIVGGLGQAFDNATVMHVGTATRLLLPTDGLWRGAVYALEPAAILTAARNLPGPATAANPFYAGADVPAAFLIWVAFWLALVLGLAVWSFRSREI
jgi:ABC-type transport system involved in multi-copper enzyme maturation permease subunit